jgi:tape measure domain-containing protein
LATETEQLVVALEARIRDFEKNFQKASGTATRNWSAIERRSDQAAKRLQASAARAGQGMSGALAGAFARASPAIGAALAAGLSVQKILGATEAFTRIGNQLKVAGLEGQKLTDVFGRLYAISQDNATPIETLVELYSKGAQAASNLGADQEKLVAFSTAVAQSLRVSGKSASESSGALTQLGQAISGSVVQAEEYNSLIDGAYPLLQAVAAGMKEAGGEVSKLTALVKDGKVSSKAFFDALLAGAPILGDKLAGSTETMAQAWTKLENSFIAAAGTLDKVVGITSTAAASLEWWASIIEAIGKRIQDAADAVDRIRNAPPLEKGSVLGPEGYPVGPEEAAALRKEGKLPPEPVAPELKAKPVIKPISLANYPVEGKSKGGRDSADEFERATQRIREHTAALGVDAEAVGKSTAEAEKMRAVQELLTAAQRAEVEVTPQVRAQIEQLATAYGNAAAHVDDLEKAQRKTIENADEFRGALSGFASGFVSDLRAGVSAADALGNALNRIVDKLLDKSIDSLIGGLFGASGTPLGGGLFGGLGKLLGFSSGGYVSGPGSARSDSIPARLSDGEFVVNAGATARHRALLETINSGRAPGFADGGLVGGSSRRGLASSTGAGGVTIAPAINVRVEGGSRGEAADKALGDNIAKSVEASVRQLVVKELIAQRRPNGLLRSI